MQRAVRAVVFSAWINGFAPGSARWYSVYAHVPFALATRLIG